MLKETAFEVIDSLPQLFSWKKQSSCCNKYWTFKKQYLMRLAYIIDILFSTRVKVTAERSQRWFYTVNKQSYYFAKKMKYHKLVCSLFCLKVCLLCLILVSKLCCPSISYILGFKKEVHLVYVSGTNINMCFSFIFWHIEFLHLTPKST